MILYIDTTSNYLYSAIVSNNKIISQVKEQLDSDLSVYAVPKIADMFDKNDIAKDDITKIIVVNGPGSFTGIRIGVTLAKVYAWTLKIDITTITSLEAMALSSKSNTTYKVPMIDARRGYVFAGIFDKDNEQIFKSKYIKLDDLKDIVKDLNDSYSWISNNDIDVSNLEAYDPDILKICNKYQDKETLNPHLVKPEYMKLTEAEENLKEAKHD